MSVGETAPPSGGQHQVVCCGGGDACVRACVGGNIPTYLVKPPPLLGLHTVDKGYCGTDADDREGERPRRPARAHPPPPIPLPRTPLQQDLPSS